MWLTLEREKMKILMVFVIVLLWSLLLYLLIIFPVMMVVKCANSNLQKNRKIFWIVGMVLLFPLMGYLYGVFLSDKLIDKITGGLCAILMVIVFASRIGAICPLVNR